MAVPKPEGGPHDGWNDPPLFTYNTATQGAASPRRTLLNKRVSFPLNNSGSAIEEMLVPQDPNSAGMLLSPKDGPPKLPPVHILPPTASTSVHPPVPLVVPTLSPPIDHSMLPPSFASAIQDSRHHESLSELLGRLELDSADSLRRYTKRVLHEMLDLCKESIQGRSREDVQTRLSLLDDQWRDGKLSEEATIKLGCLASALKNSDLKQADSLHLALMVDHISEVSQWMAGVKRLINELKLTRSPALTSLLKDLFTPSDTSASVNSSLETEVTTAEDVCIDTDKFSDLKPVLMPEVLVPNTATPEQGEPEQLIEAVQPEDLSPQQHQEQPQLNDVVDVKNDDDNTSSDR